MEHKPVLKEESIKLLNIKPDGVYVDGTAGRGGHSLEIAKRLSTGKLLAIDCDAEAITELKSQFTEYKKRVTLIHGNFRDIAKLLKTENIDAVDGAILDLGVSSPQLDDKDRGFSYMQDAKLDMRMDKRNPFSAFEIVNNRTEDDLACIFNVYGEERHSRSIARAIARKRSDSPIKTTFELNDIILSAIPPKARREKQHPSKRCFQAIRIAVGDELGALSEFLNDVPALMKTGGRICIISFHSLEDRIVKEAMSGYAKGCVCPKDFPVCVCNKEPVFKVITRKPIMADASEIEQNPRARSAKLRAAEKL